jgi:hypothetical protein
MNVRVVPMIGFLLLSLSAVGTVLAFTLVEGYNPRAGLIRNLSQAELFQKTETRNQTFPCPNPWFWSQGMRLPKPDGTYVTVSAGWSFDSRQVNRLGCPTEERAYGNSRNPLTPSSSRWPTYSRSTTRVIPGTPLGTVLALMLTVAMAGVGLVLFGVRRPQ